MKSGRRKVDMTFKKSKDKEKLGAGVSRGEGRVVKKGKKSTVIR